MADGSTISRFFAHVSPEHACPWIVLGIYGSPTAAAVSNQIARTGTKVIERQNNGGLSQANLALPLSGLSVEYYHCLDS